MTNKLVFGACSENTRINQGSTVADLIVGYPDIYGNVGVAENEIKDYFNRKTAITEIMAREYQTRITLVAEGGASVTGSEGMEVLCYVNDMTKFVSLRDITPDSVLAKFDPNNAVLERDVTRKFVLLGELYANVLDSFSAVRLALTMGLDLPLCLSTLPERHLTAFLYGYFSKERLARWVLRNHPNIINDAVEVSYDCQSFAVTHGQGFVKYSSVESFNLKHSELYAENSPEAHLYVGRLSEPVKVSRISTLDKTSKMYTLTTGTGNFISDNLICRTR